MARARTVWRCQNCGYGASRWMGRCPDCGEFETLVEEAVESDKRATAARAGSAARAVALGEVPPDLQQRVPTGVDEMDRVLGGGLVRGSIVLLGGEPGIGKSTLLLQVADALGARGLTTLYACGEESQAQVKMRADRLRLEGASVRLLSEVDVSTIEAAAEGESPDVLVVDSIQTVFDPDLTSAPGSVSQVRAGTARLMRLAKDRGITVLVVGHVTKEGSIAGPRVLEHMVDTVLYFEGDRDRAFRVVRAVKNRFGSASEIGIFEMTDRGLVAVGSPSEALLSTRPAPVVGSAVMAAMEGSRPLLVEIEALVTPSYLDTPRRLATGIDRGRLLQVLAVMERRGGVSLGARDVYVSVAGGVRVSETAADLPLALALASAERDIIVRPGMAVFGEIGLTGEVRPVPATGVRAKEAARMGLSSVATSASHRAEAPNGLEIIGVSTVEEALRLLA